MYLKSRIVEYYCQWIITHSVNGLIFDSFLHMYLLSSYYCIRIDLILGEKLKRGWGGANSRAGGNSIWGGIPVHPLCMQPCGRREEEEEER